LGPPLKVLVVLPKLSSRPGDGDNIVHRRAIERLSATMDVKTVSLVTTGKIGRLLNLFQAVPAEVARHVSWANRGIVVQAVSDHTPDVICLFNETTFPVLPSAKPSGIGVVLYAHNVHSRIVDTDKSLLSVMFRPATRAFERRFYGDPDVDLVCISEGDARYLSKSGVRFEAPVAAPGAPPDVPLKPGASIEAALVVAGGYGWWRKRRDLRRFAAARTDPEVQVYASPSAFEEAELPGAQTIEDLDWSSAIRFGVITDQFAGGFKLKAAEYVALNCAVLSFAEISADFEGLPYADLFVRLVTSRREAEIIAKTMARSAEPLAAHFAIFKDACLKRFDWAHSLDPLVAAVTKAAAKRPH
jgi:hypothetical protein